MLGEMKEMSFQFIEQLLTQARKKENTPIFKEDFEDLTALVPFLYLYVINKRPNVVIHDGPYSFTDGEKQYLTETASLKTYIHEILHEFDCILTHFEIETLSHIFAKQIERKDLTCC
jgi:hypothetical protein